MKPGDSVPSNDTIEEIAAFWLCERDEGFAPGRAEAFAAWQARDPRHAAAVAELEQTMALLEEMPAVRAPLETRVAHVPAATNESGKRFLFPFLGWAAALVFIAAAWWVWPVPPPAAERYQTAAQQQRVTLRDGSVVVLKATTDLQVQFTAGERGVTLVAGEAHFHVTRDPARPFVVTAGKVQVRVLGTAFNVRLAPEEVDVLVVEGEVAVTTPTPRGTAPSELPKLVAGERTRVARNAFSLAPAVEKIAPEEVRASLAWQNPLVTFSDEPLREVVRQFNVRNALQLVLADAALGEQRIGGIIALDQVEAFVRLLEKDGDIAVERRGNTFILRRAQ